MRYFILGSTGFIGCHLVKHLLSQGHEVTALVRSGKKSLPDSLDSADIVYGNPLAPGEWQHHVQDDNVDVVVNLVGNPILQRWTPGRKQAIHHTRMVSTRMVVQALAEARPKIFLCANAVGYFGHGGNTVLTDDAMPGKDFLATICRTWQQEAEGARAHGHRVIIGRFAPVLGKKGGLLAPLLPVFRAGLGGMLGNGRQWMSWIHIHDLCRAIVFCVDKASIQGGCNMTSPHPVTNKQFTSLLGRVLHRPTLLRVPGWGLRMVYGQAATVILNSQRCVPSRLEQAGFAFHFPNAGSALEDICSQ